MSSLNASSRLEARLPGEVYALLKRAADMQGRSLTDFVVSAASEAARKAIEDADVLRLAARDQEALARALLRPPAPSAALKRAAKRRRKSAGRS